MKIGIFGDERRVAALLGDRVIDLNAAFSCMTKTGDTAVAKDPVESALPSNLLSFIEAGDAAIDNAQAALEFAGEIEQAFGACGRPVSHSRDAVQIHPPLTPPALIFNVGFNYPDHMQNLWRLNKGEEWEIDAINAVLRKEGIKHFMKHCRNAVTDNAHVQAPKRSRFFDYEGEVAVVIGRRGRDISVDAAESYIWGFMVTNDFSIRQPGVDLAHNKNFDGSVALGSWITVREGLSPKDITFGTQVNGEHRQSCNTRDMVFSFAEIISHFSADQSLYPGDIFSGGTGAGTIVDSAPRPNGKRDPNDYLQPGDVVEIYAPQIGKLTSFISGSE